MSAIGKRLRQQSTLNGLIVQLIDWQVGVALQTIKTDADRNQKNIPAFIAYNPGILEDVAHFWFSAECHTYYLRTLYLLDD